VSSAEALGDGFDVRSIAMTLRTGANLPRHRHPWSQLVFAASGVMHVATQSAAWLTPATKAIWIPAGVEHRIEIQGEVMMRTLYIAPDRAAPLPTISRTIEVTSLLRELILHIVRIGMLDPTRAEHDRLAGVLIDLLAAARQEDLFLPLPQDARASALAQRLQKAPDEDCDLATLARACGASLQTLQRVFPKETGMTLEAWRQKARLIHSVACLTGGSSVTTAALDSGYQSVGAFIVAFSRQFGMTPGRYASARP